MANNGPPSRALKQNGSHTPPNEELLDAFNRLRPIMGTVAGVREFIMVVAQAAMEKKISSTLGVMLNGSAALLLKALNFEELDRRLAELEQKLLKMAVKNRKLHNKIRKAK